MKKLINYLNDLRSCTVTKSSAGGGAGSIAKIELEKEDSLYILYILCTWRIENKNTVVASSADNLDAVTGFVAISTKMLEGKIVDFIEISPYYDLCVTFTDGFCLRVFCVFSYTSEWDSNWELWIPDENLSFEITNHFKVKKGKYSKDQ